MKRRSPKLEGACNFLRRSLANPMSANMIFWSGGECGHSQRTLIRAARSLGVRSRRRGGRQFNAHWEWQLPPEASRNGTE